MSYRKIDVNGTIYEYVIGKSIVKIKGVGVFPKGSGSVTPASIRYLIEENTPIKTRT